MNTCQESVLTLGDNGDLLGFCGQNLHLSCTGFVHNSIVRHGLELTVLWEIFLYRERSLEEFNAFEVSN